ncbi:MAG: hypothetical protein P4L54_07875 [Acidocella sp.]|nr:hypothetical protein [Acidocella sp.]
MSRLDNFSSAGGVKLYPAEFKYQIKQARVFTDAVMFLLALFNRNTPKAPRNPAGFGREVFKHTGHHAV